MVQRKSSTNIYVPGVIDMFPVPPQMFSFHVISACSDKRPPGFRTGGVRGCFHYLSQWGSTKFTSLEQVQSGQSTDARGYLNECFPCSDHTRRLLLLHLIHVF